MASHLPELDLSFSDEEDGEAIKDQPQLEPMANEENIEPIIDVAIVVLRLPLMSLLGLDPSTTRATTAILETSQ